MARGFRATVEIDKPIDEVFAFLADGENDKRFSPRVLEIRKTTEGPPGVGTVYESTVKDAGMKSKRRFELTAFEAPMRIRWTERSKNLVTVPEGGYDLAEAAGGHTQLTVFNEFRGHGLGKLFAGPAAKAAEKDAGNFANRIKAAVEAG
jgi:uncharacterized protein YndB with AHSA1/START domain